MVKLCPATKNSLDASHPRKRGKGGKLRLLLTKLGKRGRKADTAEKGFSWEKEKRGNRINAREKGGKAAMGRGRLALKRGRRGIMILLPKLESPRSQTKGARNCQRLGGGEKKKTKALIREKKEGYSSCHMFERRLRRSLLMKWGGGEEGGGKTA